MRSWLLASISIALLASTAASAACDTPCYKAIVTQGYCHCHAGAGSGWLCCRDGINCLAEGECGIGAPSTRVTPELKPVLVASANCSRIQATHLENGAK